MPTFSYIASGPRGESLRGTLNAANKNDVAQKLKDKGLFLVFCRMDDASGPGASAVLPPAAPGVNIGHAGAPVSFTPARRPPVSAPVPINRGGLGVSPASTPPPTPHAAPSAGVPKGKISLKELVIMTRQISISINAGMSFVEALQGLSSNSKNVLMAWTIQQVLQDILSGKRFSDALAQHPTIFKPVYVSMAAAGEAGGFMPEALNRIAEFLEKEIELKAKIKSAMVYPAVIGAVATVVIIGMMTFIVPTFVRVFQDMGAPLPLPTRMLIHASDFTRHGGFMLPFVFIGLIIFAKRLREKNERFRLWWDEKALSVPLFGKLTTLEIITRFIRTLASLVGNGVMALQAITVARQVVENRIIEGVVDDIFLSVQQGNGISPVLYRSKYFPVLVANMVSTGEKTGAIPEVLNKMADYYDAEISAAIRDLLTLMEPLLIVIMAGIVGFVIAGLMLPTFQMSTIVQG